MHGGEVREGDFQVLSAVVDQVSVFPRVELVIPLFGFQELVVCELAAADAPLNSVALVGREELQRVAATGVHAVAGEDSRGHHGHELAAAEVGNREVLDDRIRKRSVLDLLRFHLERSFQLHVPLRLIRQGGVLEDLGKGWRHFRFDRVGVAGAEADEQHEHVFHDSLRMQVDVCELSINLSADFFLYNILYLLSIIAVFNVNFVIKLFYARNISA